MELSRDEKRRNLWVKTLCALLILAYLVSLVPIVYESRYNLPISDDLTVTEKVEQVWNDTRSLPVFLSACVENTLELYNTWQGTYAANFLIEVLGVLLFNPCPWLTPIVGLTLLSVSTLFLCWVLLRKILKTGCGEWLSVTALILLLMVQFCPSLYESCFWFFSMLLYGGSYSVSLVLLGVLLLLRMESGHGKRAWLFAAGVLLTLLTGGGTQPTLLPIFLLLCGFVLDGILRKDRTALTYGLLLLAIHTAGLILNVAAPGNYARLDYETGAAQAAISPITAVVLSCVHALGALLNRIEGGMLLYVAAVATLLAPFMQKGPWKFRRPFLVLLLCFGVYASLFVPLVYTKNTIGPFRVQNLYYFAMFPLLGFCTAYCTGAAIRRRQKREETASMPRFSRELFGIPFQKPLLTLLICGLLLFSSVLRQGLQRTWSYASYQDLTSGWARDYYTARLSELSGADPQATENVVLPNIINEK